MAGSGSSGSATAAAAGPPPPPRHPAPCNHEILVSAFSSGGSATAPPSPPPPPSQPSGLLDQTNDLIHVSVRRGSGAVTSEAVRALQGGEEAAAADTLLLEWTQAAAACHVVQCRAVAAPVGLFAHAAATANTPRIHSDGHSSSSSLNPLLRLFLEKRFAPPSGSPPAVDVVSDSQSSARPPPRRSFSASFAFLRQHRLRNEYQSGGPAAALLRVHSDGRLLNMIERGDDRGSAARALAQAGAVLRVCGDSSSSCGGGNDGGSVVSDSRHSGALSMPQARSQVMTATTTMCVVGDGVASYGRGQQRPATGLLSSSAIEQSKPTAAAGPSLPSPSLLFAVTQAAAEAAAALAAAYGSVRGGGGGGCYYGGGGGGGSSGDASNLDTAVSLTLRRPLVRGGGGGGGSAYGGGGQSSLEAASLAVRLPFAGGRPGGTNSRHSLEASFFGRQFPAPPTHHSSGQSSLSSPAIMALMAASSSTPGNTLPSPPRRALPPLTAAAPAVVAARPRAPPQTQRPPRAQQHPWPHGPPGSPGGRPEASESSEPVAAATSGSGVGGVGHSAALRGTVFWGLLTPSPSAE